MTYTQQQNGTGVPPKPTRADQVLIVYDKHGEYSEDGYWELYESFLNEEFQEYDFAIFCEDVNWESISWKLLTPDCELKVKQLEWRNVSTREDVRNGITRYLGVRDSSVYLIHHQFGLWQIDLNPWDWQCLKSLPSQETLKEAQAACQADFESDTLSRLEL
jgi:hypothetical protein